jgi:hypothetical protein
LVQLYPNFSCRWSFGDIHFILTFSPYRKSKKHFKVLSFPLRKEEQSLFETPCCVV